MKVIHVCSTDQGGAARAVHRLHHALLRSGYDSRFWVGRKLGDDPTVEGAKSFWQNFLATLRIRFGSLPLYLQKPLTTKDRSTGWLGSKRLLQKLNRSNAQVVHLHWVGHALLSIEQIARINKPIVWTLHDMWPFCGTEHYTNDDKEARWRSGYHAGNRREGETGVDVDRWAWERKRRYWRSRMYLIGPSQWMTECVQSSALFRNNPIQTIPNPIDLEVYRPWPADLARQAFHLPLDKRLVMFGALGGVQVSRKGFDLLLQAMPYMKQQSNRIELVVFGQNCPSPAPDFGFPVHYVGKLQDDVALAMLYNAVDVMVVPSRLDNLPQTGTEAQACGCPVVGFRTGGLTSVVEHLHTGYLAKPFDPSDLAKGIRYYIEGYNRSDLSNKIRELSIKKWDSCSIISTTKSVYGILM